MAKAKLIYLGIKGSVIALDAATGQQAWVQKLKGSDFVNVGLVGDVVLATTHGEIFGIDAQSGAIRWHDPLKGYGWGLVTMAGADLDANPLVALAEKRRRDEQAASSGDASSHSA
jgi:outer membrane protein assembly factor BamB